MEVNFEDIVNNPISSLPRQYRSYYISDDNYWMVINNKGLYYNFGTDGSGYANWYMYHTMDDRIVCIICGSNGWSWQYEGVPLITRSLELKL